MMAARVHPQNTKQFVMFCFSLICFFFEKLEVFFYLKRVFFFFGLLNGFCFLFVLNRFVSGV